MTIPDKIPPSLVFDFDMFADPRLMRDVYPGMATLFDDAPEVFYTPRNGGHWVVTDYDKIVEILKDPEHFSARGVGQIPKVETPVTLIPLTLDPPASVAYRQILMPRFSPRAIREMEPVIRQWACHFLDQIGDRGECEFMSEVASRFPVTVFMELMGIPMDRFDDFHALVEEFLSVIPDERRYEVSNALYGYIDDLIEARHGAPRDDLVSYLLAAQISNRPLDREELHAMCFLLILAGMDTVVNVLGFGFRALASLPVLQQRLQDDPTAVAGLVEEIVRLFGVSTTQRSVVSDCDFHGAPLRSGDIVHCTLPIVGWDERRNRDPDTVDVDRHERTTLAFSTGAHLCLGHILARTEIRILLEEWVKRISRFELAEGFQPQFRVGMVQGIRDLPLRWNA